MALDDLLTAMERRSAEGVPRVPGRAMTTDIDKNSRHNRHKRHSHEWQGLRVCRHKKNSRHNRHNSTSGPKNVPVVPAEISMPAHREPLPLMAVPLVPVVPAKKIISRGDARFGADHGA